MYNKLLIAALFTSATSFAERDDFNMTLEGQFEKDYCEILQLASYSGDLDPHEAIESKKNGEPVTFLPLRADQLAIRCSEGTYDFEFSTTSNVEYATSPNGLTYYTTWRYWQQYGLENTPNFGFQNIWASNPFVSTNNTVKPNVFGSITFFFQTNAYSPDGTWSNLPDNYSFPVSLIISISKH